MSDENAIPGHGLFHELVHLLQHVNDKEDVFAAQSVCLEAEAHDLQAMWQSEHEIDLAAKPEYGFVVTLYGTRNDADFSSTDWAERHGNAALE